VDQAHEEIPDIRAVVGLEEQGIFPMQNHALERPLTEIVVERSLGDAQKKGQRFPVIRHVFDGLSQ